MRPITFLLCVAAASMSGCTGFNIMTTLYNFPNTNPAREYANPYVGYRGGGIIHMNTVAGQTTGAPIEKTGRGCSHSVLWLVGWGDSSIESAKTAGQIKKVGAVDHEVFAVLGFVYHRHCTVVSGS